MLIPFSIIKFTFKGYEAKEINEQQNFNSVS